MEKTDDEKVEVLVGVVLHGEFHGKRLRFTGKEVDRYDTNESRHVLYECGPGRYRMLVSRFDDGSEIYPEPDMADETGGISYGHLLRASHHGASGREMATQGALRPLFPY